MENLKKFNPLRSFRIRVVLFPPDVRSSPVPMPLTYCFCNRKFDQNIFNKELTK